MVNAARRGLGIGRFGTKSRRDCVGRAARPRLPMDVSFTKAVLDGIIRRGVFIRKPALAPLDRLIRVTVGRDEDLALFAGALNETLAELR